MNAQLVVIETNENKPLAEPMSLGEVKARHREQHLCLRCIHQAVCKVVAATDPQMLVIIRQCMMFEPDEVAAGGKA